MICMDLVENDEPYLMIAENISTISPEQHILQHQVVGQQNVVCKDRGEEHRQAGPVKFGSPAILCGRRVNPGPTAWLVAGEGRRHACNGP